MARARILPVALVGALVAALAVVLFFVVVPVRAAGVVGTGTSGSCTESALASAVAGGGAVTFNCGPAAYTIVLTSTIDVNDSVDINGADKITLSGGNTTRIFATFLGADLDLHHIILSNGYSTAEGGAIRQVSPMTLDHVTISNSASETNGGAIYNSAAPLTVNDSVFSNNQAQNGGALYLDSSADNVKLTNTTFSHNSASNPSHDIFSGYGGAILVATSAKVEISGGVIFSNTAEYGGGISFDASDSSLAIKGNALLNANRANSNGGGIFIRNNGTVTVADSTVSANSAGNAGGGISQLLGTIWLTRTQVLDNQAGYAGGGLNIDNIAETTAYTTTYLTESTVNGNESEQDGGGIYLSLFSHANIKDSTISNNTYGSFGGGIYATPYAAATLSNVTISGNHPAAIEGTQSGGGMYLSSYVILEGVTIANNDADEGGGVYFDDSDGGIFRSVALVGNTPSDCTSSGLQGANFSLDSDGSCHLEGLETGYNNRSNGNGNLGSLANNGGSVKTLLPLAGSDLIDAGTCEGIPAKDARGVTRPQGGACDIGAVEVRPTSTSTTREYLPMINK